MTALKPETSFLRPRLSLCTLACTLACLTLIPKHASAGALLAQAEKPTQSSPLHIGDQPLIAQTVAQADGDDAYDPFADYSEFEESADEEEDLNFFKNGRMLTLGFLGGYRGFTGNLGKLYSGSPDFGLFLSYFFDLRFALQFGYLTSDHTIVLRGSGYDPIQGTVNISDVSILIKYYFNTQNVTRGLADLNPYLIGGFSEIFRTATVSGVSSFAKDSAFGFDLGAGLEWPIMHNKMYFGLQGMYQLVNFSDEASVIQDDKGKSTGFTPSGDSYTVLGILGVNF